MGNISVRKIVSKSLIRAPILISLLLMITFLFFIISNLQPKVIKILPSCQEYNLIGYAFSLYLKF